MNKIGVEFTKLVAKSAVLFAVIQEAEKEHGLNPETFYALYKSNGLPKEIDVRVWLSRYAALSKMGREIEQMLEEMKQDSGEA